MILPIYTYGQPVLREKATAIDEHYTGLQNIIENMFETMYNAEGIGLAAPQVGLPINLIIIDANTMAKDCPECKNFKRVMINPEITEYSEDTISMEEGCLSFPGIHEKVSRAATIRVKYMDENFEEQDEVLTKFVARIVQHECDHLKGHVFIDEIAPIRRQLNKKKLNNLIKGSFSCKYKTKPFK